MFFWSTSNTFIKFLISFFDSAAFLVIRFYYSSDRNSRVNSAPVLIDNFDPHAKKMHGLMQSSAILRAELWLCISYFGTIFIAAWQLFCLFWPFMHIFCEKTKKNSFWLRFIFLKLTTWRLPKVKPLSKFLSGSRRTQILDVAP